MSNNIHPCIWFDNKAQEAANFYCTVFDNSMITAQNPIVTNIEIAGQKFMMLNGGPMFKPNPSISLFVFCLTVEESDNIWSKLSEGGTVMMPLDKYEWSEYYGWCNDKYGVSWQIYTGIKENFKQKITPTFMFVGDQCGRATEAIHFYQGIFNDSSIEGILHYSKGDHDRIELVKHAEFKIDQYLCMAMDSSGPHEFGFDEGMSMVVTCENQAEIDHFWHKLTDGGQESRCGWLKDKFGISWQIVPKILGQLMEDPNRSQRVVQAFMKMNKFEIQALLDA